jgi:hypothetical protein
MELRLGLRARSTRDVDVVFRGAPSEMPDAMDEAFEPTAGGFSFRRKGPVTTIRDTGSRRLGVQVGFAGRDWQTLQVEVGPPEVDEIEFVPVAIPRKPAILGPHRPGPPATARRRRHPSDPG